MTVKLYLQLHCNFLDILYSALGFEASRKNPVTPLEVTGFLLWR